MKDIVTMGVAARTGNGDAILGSMGYGVGRGRGGMRQPGDPGQ